MAAIAGWLNHTAAAADSPSNVRPMAGETGGTGTSTENSAGITSNDFLTLLVTELKNQDPTANSDPNQYINQLVGVNSLQQLIQINETLSANTSTPVASPVTTPGGGVPAYGHPPASNAAAAVHHSTIKTVSGNLNVPETTPAASRVAQSLSGKH